MTNPAGDVLNFAKIRKPKSLAWRYGDVTVVVIFGHGLGFDLKKISETPILISPSKNRYFRVKSCSTATRSSLINPAARKPFKISGRRGKLGPDVL